MVNINKPKNIWSSASQQRARDQRKEVKENHSSAGASKNKFVEMEKNVNRMNRSEMMVRKEKQMVEGAAFARPAEIY